MVGASGFEPPASWSRTKRSSQAELRPAIQLSIPGRHPLPAVSVTHARPAARTSATPLTSGPDPPLCRSNTPRDWARHFRATDREACAPNATQPPRARTDHSAKPLLVAIRLAPLLPFMRCDLPLPKFSAARHSVMLLRLFFADSVHVDQPSRQLVVVEHGLFVPIIQQSILHSPARFKYQLPVTLANQLNPFVLRIHSSPP